VIYIYDFGFIKLEDNVIHGVKPEEILRFNPDVLGVFNKLNKVTETYKEYCFPKVNNLKINMHCLEFGKF
jgi:hypothetical protein